MYVCQVMVSCCEDKLLSVLWDSFLYIGSALDIGLLSVSYCVGRVFSCSALILAVVRGFC